MKVNVLLTGSSGFIGQNLRNYLEKNQKIQISIFRLLRDNNAINFPERSITWNTVDAAWLDSSKIDAIVHVAGIAHDFSGKYSEVNYDQVNFQLTKKLYQEFLGSRHTSKFIFMSSVKALSDEPKELLTEDAVPSPKTPYGKSKLKAEQFIRSNQGNNKSSYILRPTMVYGPKNKGNLNTLYKFLSKGYPYPFGSFKNKRSFLSVNNLNFIILQVLLGRVNPGDYNCADSTDLSSVELVNLIGKAINKKPRVLNLSTSLIRGLASIGSKFSLPFNKQVLGKLTGSYCVSTEKILQTLAIKELPYNIEDELVKTIRTFEEH
ncbi:MAG: NAD-dependent epimerase/dehydratase family protein [Bacteroidota bacterium]